MAWNTSHTRRKSTQLHDLDCRTTGSVKTSTTTGPWTGIGVFTSDEIIEPGECIAMLRVPRGLTVTGGMMAWQVGAGSASNVALGLGDPFACGRLLGYINAANSSSGVRCILPEGTTCAHMAIIAKTGGTGDGCGLGYTYTCETDIIVTVGYGDAGFERGGGYASTGPVSGTTGVVAPLPSGSRLFVRLDGILNAVPGSNLS